ncbi:entericidin A/B family lipoprotein [Paraburkholderia lycopersici]|uniref:Entericidin EcnA/B family protein n=1 Tax=Paraburkholderia lycopersici TaxID=416944 RepID=A0A1G6WJ72_9BURK|nr:entericidin A/B family lipoprotein [Paraburkholderia lycopersici]SDD65125.1 Entericidin EcnA/B family protein [Paraburkholderia lycopersici]
MTVNAVTRRVALFVMAGWLLALAGCNTVAGVGEDISDSARAVQRKL